MNNGFVLVVEIELTLSTRVHPDLFDRAGQVKLLTV